MIDGFVVEKSKHKTPAPWQLGKYTSLIILFSFGLNLLGLIGAIYMMQVYDRVLSSGSVPTLIGLSIIAFILFTSNCTFHYQIKFSKN